MLNGIRIIDFTQYLPGPHATLRLADMGAEVIKVESPSGDPSRASSSEHGIGFVFQAQNRDKKSMVLNLKEKADQQAALDLIGTADVVIEGFRPGVMNRLGIGYEQALQCKKDIIYCSVTGYGQSGSISHLGGHDINYLSLSGVLAQFKDQNGQPILPSTTIADFVGGITATERILAALVRRGSTGEGAFIDISITDSLLSLMSNHVMIESLTGDQHGIPRVNSKHICYGIYKTKDNRYVGLGALEPKFWSNFCKNVNREDWLSAHFSLANDENPVFLEVKDLFANRTLAEWEQFSKEVDCCLTPVLETSELYSHPTYHGRGMIVEQNHLRYMSTKYGMGEEKLEELISPPALGEHTLEFKC
ncbi:CaiB/BaiF CoA transferase family protein [Bacillus sp. JJ722]|uniref:CaiB/BaiF CoA transferase family protein n=1 Tax=Bacillus sp. JJ722 TaxID=3122973 RepID=UPI002FFF9106